MRQLRHLSRVLLLGVCLGVCLVFVQNALGMETGVFLRRYFLLAGGFLAAAAVLSAAYLQRYRKKMQEALPFLEAKAYRAYIKAVEALLQTARGRYLRNLLRLNLTAGYCGLEQYGHAISILEDLEGQRLGAEGEMVRRLNLCVCYFYSGQTREALALYDDSQGVFGRFRSSDAFGGNLAVVEMLALVERKRYAEAQALLDETRERWDLPRLQEDYQHIQERLDSASSGPGGA